MFGLRPSGLEFRVLCLEDIHLIIRRGRGWFGSSDRALDACVCDHSNYVAARTERTLERHKWLSEKCSILHHYFYILWIVLGGLFHAHTIHADHIQSLSLYIHAAITSPVPPTTWTASKNGLTWSMSTLMKLATSMINLIEILCDVHLMSYDGFVHFQIP